MKRKGLVVSVALALLLVFTVSGAKAQVYNPLALGAFGAAVGFAAGGSAAAAAIGGAAGVGAGLLLSAPYARADYAYYDGPAVRTAYVYGPGYYPGYYRAYYPGYYYRGWGYPYYGWGWRHHYHHRYYHHRY